LVVRAWRFFQDEYANAFEDADYVLLARCLIVRKALEKGKTLDTRKLIEDIEKQDKPAFALAKRRGDYRTSTTATSRGRHPGNHVEWQL